MLFELFSTCPNYQTPVPGRVAKLLGGSKTKKGRPLLSETAAYTDNESTGLLFCHGITPLNSCVNQEPRQLCGPVLMLPGR